VRTSAGAVELRTAVVLTRMEASVMPYVVTSAFLA